MQQEESKDKGKDKRLKLQLFILDLLVLDRDSKGSKGSNIARLYMRMEEICLRRRRGLVGRF
jgi:hypothetical protein